MLKRLRGWWSEFFDPKTTEPGIVVCDDLGISLTRPSRAGMPQHRIAWHEIGAVFAYKQDCYTVDQICLTVVDLSGTARLVISEDDGGYQHLVEQLPNHLPGCLTPGDWFHQVAFPAFETNWTELYRLPLVEPPDGGVVASLGRMADPAASAGLRTLAGHLQHAIPGGLCGSLRFWGECFGSPYSQRHRLVSCEVDGVVLRLVFDQRETLSVWSPGGLTIHRAGFRIADARRVRWEWHAHGRAHTRDKLCVLEFARSGEIITTSTNGDGVNPSMNPDAAQAAVELVNRLD
ncbi:MAG: hypothetical protein QM757_09930 [Paludibaculum sp.]